MSQIEKTATRAWWSGESAMENFEYYIAAERPEDAVGTLCFTGNDMTKHGWVEAGTAEITFTGHPRSEVVVFLVESMREQQQQMRAQVESSCRKLEERIQSLLAITHEPESFHES